MMFGSGTPLLISSLIACTAEFPAIQNILLFIFPCLVFSSTTSTENNESDLSRGLGLAKEHAFLKCLRVASRR